MARVDVLGHGVFEETGRREYRTAARPDVVRCRHAERAAEMVDVRMGVDQPRHRAVAAMRPVQPQRGGRGLPGDQRVDDDDTGRAFHQCHIGQVQAPDLVDARNHLVETLFRDQSRLAPETRMYRGRTGFPQERVRIVVPDDLTGGVAHDTRVEPGDPAPIGVGEIRGVREG
jgi:hypothetical protein